MAGAAELRKSDFGRNSREQTFLLIAEAFGIDGINLPVLLLDGSVRVLAANAKANEFFSGRRSQIDGRLLGEVIGCVHAGGPGVCGETFRCASCAIRLTVIYTMVTGEECREVPVYPDADPPCRDRNVSLVISTKKIFNFVFLTIRKSNTSLSQ